MNKNHAILVIALLASIKFIFIPWNENVHESHFRLKSMLEQLHRLQVINDDSLLVKENIKKNSDILAKLDSKAFSSNRANATSESFSHIQTMAQSSQARVRNMRIGEKQNRDVDFYPIEFLVEGNPIEISHFFNLVAQRERQLFIAQASMRKDQRTQNITTFITAYAIVKPGEKE